MDDPMLATKSRWRKHSLRTFLICITCLCVVIGRITVTANQQRAVKGELNRYGASTYYGHEWTLFEDTQSSTSRLLAPFARWIDPDFLVPIAIVCTRPLEEQELKAGAKYTPADVIVPISKLHGLQILTLTHTNVTNENIAQLTHLSQLHHLSLNMTKLRESPIPGLEKLRLRTLVLSRTRINDESLSTLQTMTTLEHLNLTRTKVTDDGLKYLESLPNLRWLNLRRTLVTQRGYEKFQKDHPQIEVFWEPLTSR